jgi:hypothetical protein
MRRKYCDRCLEARRVARVEEKRDLAEAARQWNRRRESEKPAYYRVVSCPCEEFRRGAEFYYGEFCQTLNMGYLPDGLVVERIATGERLQVFGYRMVLISDGD